MLNNINKLFCCITFLLFGSQELKSQDSTVQLIDGCKYAIDISVNLLPLVYNVYNKEKIKQLDYEQLQFSPNGRFLAIVFAIDTSSSESPNKEVIIYDVITKKAKLIIQHDFGQKIKTNIKDIHWNSNNLLSVFIWRVDEVFRITASMDTSIIEKYKGTDEKAFINEDDWYIYSTSPSGKWRFIYSSQDDTLSLIDLHNKRSYLWPSKYSFGNTCPCVDARRFKWTVDEKYVVFGLGGGSGGITLWASLMNTSPKPFKIAWSSWELCGFCVAPKGHLVAYLNDDISDIKIHRSKILIYNLDKHKNVKSIQIGMTPEIVQWSSQNIFAVTCRSCSSDIQGTIHFGLYLYDVSSLF